jgi:hypothetical protein
MKTENKIIIAVAVGGGAFLIWKNWDKISEMFKKKDATNGGEPKKDDDVNKGGGSSAPVDSVYSSAVRRLQEILGVAVDGDAGKQTNGRLEWYFCDYLCEFNPDKAFNENYPSLRKNGKGKVSPSNVVFYIEALRSASSPRQSLNKGLDAQAKLKEFMAKYGL